MRRGAYEYHYFIKIPTCLQENQRSESQNISEIPLQKCSAGVQNLLRLKHRAVLLPHQRTNFAQEFDADFKTGIESAPGVFFAECHHEIENMIVFL